ncbi:MAG: hypothetical protein FWH19_02385 [Treponema sp.]|nr:hypothetical protein [Treponema sp.]
MRAITLFLFLILAAELFAFGRREVVEEEELNPQWVLCITAIDASGLPMTRQLIGDTVARTLADSLSRLNVRFRGEEEETYYRDYALAGQRSAAARDLVNRRTERDLLIFRGDPEWRYQRALRNVDQAIRDLEEKLQEIDALDPLVDPRPLFVLSDDNLNNIFPLPPEPGHEFRFLREHEADGFLVGSLSEYHDRIFLTLRLYTLYSRSFVFEHSVLFSTDDFNEVMYGAAGRLALAVSESQSASIVVRASVEDALLLINDRFANVGEVHALSPGTTEITVQAEHHRPATFTIDLDAAELTDVFIDLTPFAMASFGIYVPSSPGSRVFLGSMYIGEEPLILELPRNEFVYMSVETPEGEIGTAVYRDNALLRGNARFIRDPEEIDRRAIFFVTSPPISPEEERVATARNSLYRNYGVFWIILPVSLLAVGIAGTYVDADNFVTRNNYGLDPARRQSLSNSASLGRLVTYGSYGAIGVSLGMTFWQVFRYINASKDDPTPIVNVGRTEE